MKNYILMIFALSLLACSSINVLAVEIVMDDSYLPGETIIGRIDGNFIDPLSHDDIAFYEDRKIIPMIYDISKIGSSYYFYAVLPLEVRDYSLVISDAHFFDAGKELTADIIKNFSVSGNIIDFSVNPGIVITNKDFDVLVKNYGNSLTLNVEFPEGTDVGSVNVGFGQSEKLSFGVTNAPEFATLVISSNNTAYSIPVVILNPSIPADNSLNISNNILRIIPNNLTLRALKNSSDERFFNITLENIGVDDITNIEFSYPEALGNLVEFIPANFSVIKAGSIASFVLRVFPLTTANFSSDIVAFSSDNPSITASMDLFLEIFPENYSKPIVNDPSVVLENYTPPILSSCLALNGRICLSGEVCKGGELVDSRDGSCCIGGGVCVLDDSSGIFSKVIIVLLLVGIVVVGIIIFRKYKGANSNLTPEKILKKKQASFDKSLK